MKVTEFSAQKLADGTWGFQDGVYLGMESERYHADSAIGFRLADLDLARWCDHPGYLTGEGSELNETARAARPPRWPTPRKTLESGGQFRVLLDHGGSHHDARPVVITEHGLAGVRDPL